MIRYSAIRREQHIAQNEFSSFTDKISAWRCLDLVRKQPTNILHRQSGGGGAYGVVCWPLFAKDHHQDGV